jgi:hypothetical protein
MGVSLGEGGNYSEINHLLSVVASLERRRALATIAIYFHSGLPRYRII